MTTYTDRNGVDWRLDEFIAAAHPSIGALVESLRADLRDALADRARLQRANRDLDAELSAAEHRLTLVADARGHGLSC